MFVAALQRVLDECNTQGNQLCYDQGSFQQFVSQHCTRSRLLLPLMVVAGFCYTMSKATHCVYTRSPHAVITFWEGGVGYV